MTRIFVGNLPTEIVEKEVENEFAAYGIVTKVEVKHKRDPLSNDIMSTFAFVTMNITDNLLDQCLQEFKNEKFRGRFLTVSVARENFMEKLQREREESSTQQSPLQNAKSNVSVRPIVTTNPFRLIAETNAKIIRTFDSDDEESKNDSIPMSNSTTELEPCIKRKSKLFTENGKIKIPSFNESNLVAQTAKKNERKSFDEKSEKADRKRVESLINMKNTYNQQKKTVQQALSNMATTKNNKIIFDEPNSEFLSMPPKKSKLFDDTDGDDVLDYQKSFEIKKQYEGESGARLQKLQSRFQNDQRFKMNENFLDATEDDVDEYKDNEIDGNVVTKTDERKWQYDMLESVIGKKLQPEVKKRSDNLMLRYDPTKNDHEKYEKVTKRKARTSEMDSEPVKLNDESEFQVSKEQFFNVTNQLTSALKPASEGFSLLSMFGRDSDRAETAQKNTYNEISLTKGQQNMLASSRSSVFKADSSDEETFSHGVSKSKNPLVDGSKPRNSKKNAKSDIWHEPFFIFECDQRLQDGLSFFLPNSLDGKLAEDFENKQKEMRNIIKRKIKKSIKRVLPRGAKPNKRFGRLVKDIA